MVKKEKGTKRLEEHEPGATRHQVLGALGKVSATTNDRRPAKSGAVPPSDKEQELVEKAAEHIVKLNQAAFKELASR